MAAPKASATNAKQAALEEALKQINSQLKTESGDPLVARFGDKPRNIPTVSTGSLVLDSLLGGGFAVGRVIEVFGPEASGKTSIALTAAGNVQKEGGTVAFIDLEHALDPYYAETLGVNMTDLIFAQPDYAEQSLELMLKLINSGMVNMIVLDSVAALIPKAEFEGTLEDQTIGLVARILSRGLKKIAGAAAKNNVTIIFINQTRAAIGGYSPMGTPETTTGGKALAFYASQRVRVAGSKQITEGKDTIGKEVRLNVKKNKIAPPFLQGTTVLTFAQGINKVDELIEVGPQFGVIDRPNNRTYIEHETGEKIGSSKAEALEALENNQELFDRIAAKLQTAISESVVNRRSTGKKTLLEANPDSGEIVADPNTGEVLDDEEDES